MNLLLPVAALLLAAPATAQAPAATAVRPMTAAPLGPLIARVDIPYERFVLPNGLTVLVHTDRKAPVVAVSVWYHVGSKDEPAGQTGFAHLFEHLMFNGSENSPGDFFEPLQQVGATDYNGTTWFDRTNYFETVPTPALDLALFLESDRMGHLLGAVTQEKLDNQRGVVQNEKRQGDNQPYGLTEYAQLQALFPAGHPYHHSTIGSMADLDAASLTTVKDWFRAKYGPNNAVLVLAGDVDVATARRLVTKYFGDIPRGPAVTPAAAAVPTLAKRVDETMTDRVAATRLYRNWVVPGLADRDFVPLDVAATVLGGLASSRLDNILVRDEKVAVAVSASVQEFERVSLFEVTVDVKPGADPAAVGRRLDAIIADFIARGPTRDEVERVATRQVAGRIAGLESVGGFGGKAVALAEGALYTGDPDFYRKRLQQYAAVTPAEVAAAARKWLSRPVYALTVSPGERKPYEEAKASRASFAPSYYRAPARGERPLAPPARAADQGPAAGAGVEEPPQNPARPARVPPAVGTIADLSFPTVERTTLSNGIGVVYARRDAVPMTRVSVTFDAGNAADPRTAPGTQSLMLSLLDEGTTTRNSVQIAEEQERLGAQIGAGASTDRTSVQLSALSANLVPSVALLADIVRNPAFAPAEVARLRDSQLTRIQAELTSPAGVASRVLNPALFGPAHPYGAPPSGTGDPKAVAALTPAALAAFHDAWIRPDGATIFVVSDLPLAQVRAALETGFGDWRAKPGTARGTKAFTAAIPAPAPRILLVDRKDSPQSFILGGVVLAAKGTDRLESLDLANDVLGGSFLSRLNTDLRETRGWSYGVRSAVRPYRENVSYVIQAPVQADQTGPSLKALIDDTRAFLGPQGVTAPERDRTINGAVRELAGSYETGADVLGALQANALYGRPDDYQATLADTYRAQTVAGLDRAARAAIDPAKMVWVVVGDAAKVRPQLGALGLPVETVTLPAGE